MDKKVPLTFEEFVAEREYAAKKAELDSDFYHEENAMGGTVIQGQQSDEWKEANPFQNAANEAAMQRAEAKTRQEANEYYERLNAESKGYHKALGTVPVYSEKKEVPLNLYKD